MADYLLQAKKLASLYHRARGVDDKNLMALAEAAMAETAAAEAAAVRSMVAEAMVAEALTQIEE